MPKRGNRRDLFRFVRIASRKHAAEAGQEAIAKETQGGGGNVVELPEMTVTPESEPEPEKTAETVSAAAPEGQATEAGARPAPDDSAGASPVAIRPYRHSPDGSGPLSACKVEELVRKYSTITFELRTQDALRGDLNAAIWEFKFRQGYATAPTLTQFRKRFDRLRAALRRVKGELPPIDRQNDLFNYIRRLGEAYAAAHGPHPGIEPREFPSLSGFGLEDEPPDFNSAQRLRELIESVEQVTRWMAYYNEDLVPKTGWSKLEKIYGPTHSSELWLIGKQLPAIFIKYFGRSKGPNRAGQGYSRCDGFVVDVLDCAGIKTNKNKPYEADSVEKYRRRARKPEGFELTDKVN
jgi:hypothetical protein